LGLRGFRRLDGELVEALDLFQGEVVIALGGIDDALEAGELLVGAPEGLSGRVLIIDPIAGREGPGEELRLNDGVASQ
jgi:hypothetical protein